MKRLCSISVVLAVATLAACAPEPSGESSPSASTAAAPSPTVSRLLMPPGGQVIEPAQIATRGGAAEPSIQSVTSALKIPGATTCPNNVVNHGGTSIAHGRIDVVYWGSAVNLHHQLNYLAGIAQNRAFYNRLHEYGVSTGTFGQFFDFPQGASSPFLLDTTIVAGIKQAIGSFVPTSSDIIVVMLPSDASAGLDFGGNFLGHHASFTLNGAQIPYATVEWVNGDSQLQQIIASHEIVEALTDPDATVTCNNSNCSGSVGHGWWDAASGEVGDLCQGLPSRQIAGLTTTQIWSQASCACKGLEDLNNADVLGTGRFDRVIFRPSEQKWYPQNFTARWVMGPGLPTTGDFNGDGITEFSTLTPGAPGTMSILNIGSGTVKNVSVGTGTSDIPVPGDYDGDGKTDVAVWNTSYGNWAIIQSTLGADTRQWGQFPDVPVPADYDGDGRTDRAIFRASDKSWWIMPSNGNPTIHITWSILAAGDQPVAGDFNGDNKADFAFWRPSDGTWHVSYAGTSFAFSFGWGQNGDVPLGRDFDGDFITDLAVWRPSNGVWYNVNSSTWGTSSSGWGVSTDIPLKQ